jgi:hypothetical protein
MARRETRARTIEGRETMRIQAVCIALCALAPVTASAGSHFDIHYTPMATFGDDEVAAKGDGFGARLRGDAGTLMYGFEYSTADYSIIDESVDQLRFGIGMQTGDVASFHGEYVKFEILGTDADGFGAHVQFGQQANAGAGAFLRLGYLSMDADGVGVDGFEYTVGANFPVGTVRGLLEYRASLLEDEDGFELYLEDLHVGVSVPFGG